MGMGQSCTSRLAAVPLPASREQINKLGDRLAADRAPSDDDLRQLEELVACHMTALELARPRLDDLAERAGTPVLYIAHRAKTTQTIIEKLRREHRMLLARMQDLAGIRVIGAVSFERATSARSGGRPEVPHRSSAG
jgi:ppGpp synthetase/RelA/SpoT-type nucleotidyltranferase